MKIEILNKIGNKKLIAAFEASDMQVFGKIASKLYAKARIVQDKKEFLLAECIKYSRNEDTSIETAMEKFNNMNAQEIGLKARNYIQASEKYLTETDPLRKYDMKETAYENAYENAFRANS